MKLRLSAGRRTALILVLALCLGPLSLTAKAEAHSHTWRTDWAFDSYHHWHGCSGPDCRTLVPAQADGYAYHSYDSPRDAVCNVCGWVRAVDPGHIHTWSSEWESDTSHHWQRCGDPECPGVVPGWAKGYEEHIYGGSEESCCLVCGRPRLLNPAHTHTWGAGWNGDSTSHWRRCTGADCPGVVPIDAEGYGPHVYDGSQDPDCNVCGKNRFVDPDHTHTWGSDWSSNGIHHWHACTGSGCPGVVPNWAEGYAPHIYDGGMDPDCNVCGAIRVVLPPSDGDWFDAEEPDAHITLTGRGWVRVRPLSPKEGDKVTVILIPAEHYTAGGVAATGPDGTSIPTVKTDGGAWSFFQPAEEVKLHAQFLPSYQACPQDGSCLLAAFRDLDPAQWYHDGIHYCLDWELMHGCNQNEFAPQSGLSRGMMAQILYNMAGRPEIPGGSLYENTGLWYDTAAAWAAGAGVMDAGGRFNAGEPVTREQLAVMLWRCAGRPAVSGGPLPFADAGSVSPWAAQAVEWAVSREILCGRGDGRLDPGGRLTRAEGAAVLVRFHSQAAPVWQK